MKLFMVHCGFYDKELSNGIYEFHVNYFKVAKDAEEARLKIKQTDVYQAKRMHVDGIEEVQFVDGYEILIKNNPTELSAAPSV